MATSRELSVGRMCRRYRIFFYIAALLVSLQLFLAYNFYSTYQEEIKVLETWKTRVKKIEDEHQRDIIHGERTVKEDTQGDLTKNDLDSKNIHHNSTGSRQQNVILNENNLHTQTEKRTKYQPKCAISSKDAVSALQRAHTDTCRQEIADATCRLQEGTLYPRKLPRYCPLQGDNFGEYVGCFKDNASSRVVASHHTEFRENNSPTTCMYHCLRSGYKYAGLEFGYECWCSALLKPAVKLPDTECDSLCPGEKSSKCGAYLILSVYHTGVGMQPQNPAGLIRADDVADKDKARIVFVLTINGRSDRQIRRLFKALFHVDHYFYIHVDSRQEYLYRELTPLERDFPNVRLARTRYSTIWGGASLLTMLLGCMKDLLSLRHWKWDFFINLSESDYPVKTSDDLVAFLTDQKDKNFVKSHGRDTPRFIRKQGLDKLFYECDTHMWRLGPRPLQDGIRIDGGSDWIALNRDFCRYVLTSQDDMVVGLKQYWKYALLPAESFFHTVLQNSRYCGTIVQNNLHLTNWRRKQGCKCQYKHIVDWCGCSPNDFLPKDMEKIMATEERPIFFARKFEPVVSQEVINMMDIYLFGNFPEDMVGLNSFWLNEYHHLDPLGGVDGAYLTFYHSFSRLSTRRVENQLGTPGCRFTPGKVLQAHVYNYADTFQGLLVMFEGKGAVDRLNYTLETHLEHHRLYNMLRSIGPISRIKNIEVGNSFDPKEEIFRNYGRLLGPYSDLVLMHSWGPGKAFTMTVAYIDPAGVIAASYDLPVKPEAHTGTHKPIFNKPLRPGVWTVKIVCWWEVVAELRFAVIPLSHHKGQDITNTDVRHIHSGPAIPYVQQDFSNLKDMLRLDDVDGLARTAEENAVKSGKDLLTWIDEIVATFWKVSDSCVDGISPSSCPALAVCKWTTWSSKTPDPKSKIGQVNPNTGRLR